MMRTGETSAGATGSHGIVFTDYRVRVRYAETDQMGVAYHANYFVWFEVGRSEFCRQRGFSYQEMERETERFLIVAEAYCRFMTPLYYDREVTVRTFLQELRRRAVRFSYQLLDTESGVICATGETLHIVVDSRGKPKSFPGRFRKLLGGVHP